MLKLVCLLLSIAGSSLWAQSTPDILHYYPPLGVEEYTHLKTKKHYHQYFRKIKGVHPVTRNDMPISMYLYLSKSSGPRPLVIVVPPVEGLSFRERKVARSFTKRGVHVAVLMPVLDATDISVPIEGFQNAYLAAVAAVRSTVDDLVTLPQVDHSKIILWASSLGAIIGSTAFSVDDRFRAALFIAGGGDVADIITESRQSKVRKYRQHRMQEEGLTLEEFRKKLQDSFVVDPLLYAHRRDSEDLVFVMSGKDSAVPTSNQWQLWDAFGQPKFFYYSCFNHAFTLVHSHTLGIRRYVREILKKL